MILKIEVIKRLTFRLTAVNNARSACLSKYGGQFVGWVIEERFFVLFELLLAIYTIDT